MRTEASYLPWESVEGPVYYARDLKPRKKWVTAGSWFMSALLIVGGIITPYRVALVFGILYIFALLMKKDTVVTTRGLEIFYQMHITTQYDFWSWDNIASVTREDRKHPELVALHISNGEKVRRLFFTKTDAQKIMRLAKTQSHRILVGDADESQMIGYHDEKKNKKK